MNAAADALSPPSSKKPRAARAKKRLADELPVRIGGMEYARTASTPARVMGPGTLASRSAVCRAAMKPARPCGVGASSYQRARAAR